MTARDAAPAGPKRHHHLWPHGDEVLDLGDDAAVAAHLDDFAAHDYELRGVRLLGVGPAHVLAYYDTQRQSGLTQKQRDLVRAWVRRYAAPENGASAPPHAREPQPPAAGPHRAAGRRLSAEQATWLAIALAPALLALAFVAYGTLVDGAAVRRGAVLVSAASVLALVSAVITWRRAGSGAGTGRASAGTAGARG